MTAIKTDIINRVADKGNLTKKSAESLVDTILDAMFEALLSEERIEIRGFGSFQVKDRNAREGRNPRSGQKVSVAAKKVPFFKAGKELRTKLKELDLELLNK